MKSIDNSAANAHNKKQFPHGIALTGNGAMCAKEYSDLQNSLHNAHVHSHIEHVATTLDQQARDRRAERDRINESNDFW